MRFAKTLLLSATVFGMAGAAHAQDTGLYAGIGVDAVEFDAYTLSGRLGYNFNEYFGIEGQAGFGIIDDEETAGTIEAEAGIDHLVGAFAVARAPLSEQFDVFARGGYYFAQVGIEIEDTAAGPILDDSGDIDGLAFGVGAQFNFGEGNLNGIRAEYTYLDVDDVTVGNTNTSVDADGDLWSLSFIRKF